MSAPQFVVSLADLERGPREVEWALPEAWLRQTFADTDAVPAEAGVLRVTLTKSGREVVAQGSAHARVTLPDSLTLEPVTIELVPEILLLLSPASTPEPAGRARRAGRKAARPTAKPSEEHPKAAKARKPTAWDRDPELSDNDAAQDTYSGEQVVLDGFVREFLLLELPMTVRSSLPSTEDPAIAPPSAEPEAAEPHPIDPRLAPLAAIASRLRQNKE